MCGRNGGGSVGRVQGTIGTRGHSTCFTPGVFRVRGLRRALRLFRWGGAVCHGWGLSSTTLTTGGVVVGGRSVLCRGRLFFTVFAARIGGGFASYFFIGVSNTVLAMPSQEIPCIL